MGTRKGFTLTEVMIGILLTALVVSSIMAVVLTARRDAPRADRKMAGSYAAKQLMDQLKNYISASITGTDAGSGPCTNTSGSPPCPSSAGPLGPQATWGFPGDQQTFPGTAPFCAVVGSSCAGDSSTNPCGANILALQTGCLHNATYLLPKSLIDDGASMCYCVTDLGASTGYGDPKFLPKIDVSVSFIENAV